MERRHRTGGEQLLGHHRRGSADADANFHCDGYPHAHAHLDGYAHAHAHPDGYAHAHAHPDSHAESDSDPDPEPDRGWLRWMFGDLCDYQTWTGGFTANVTVTDTGSTATPTA
ncbi:MAG: hypothetical protein ABJA87_06635 [bacterium]